MTEQVDKFAIPKSIKDATDIQSWFEIVKHTLSSKFEVTKCDYEYNLIINCDSNIPKERYTLDIEKIITINASTDAGVIYALQTLKQLIGFDKNSITV